MKGLRHRPVFTTVAAASLSQRTVMRSPLQRAPHNFKATTIVKSFKELISRFCSEIKGGKTPWKYWSSHTPLQPARHASVENTASGEVHLAMLIIDTPLYSRKKRRHQTKEALVVKLTSHIISSSNQANFFFWFSDLNPCLNVVCPSFGVCKAYSPHGTRCVCFEDCPTYQDPVCSASGTTYDNKCWQELSYCKGLDKTLVYHPGRCEGGWE